MVEKTEAEQKVLNAAREWIADRQPKSREEKVLFVAVARCWPEDMPGKEGCTCGEQDDCDECESSAEIEAAIQRFERDLAKTQNIGLCVTTG